MEKGIVLKNINAIIVDIIGSEIVINEKMVLNEIDDLDSLQQVSLIASLQNDYNITFNMNEITKIKTVGDLVDVICFKTP